MQITTSFQPFFLTSAPRRVGGSGLNGHSELLRWEVNAERVELALALPGFAIDAIDITLNGKLLQIQAQRDAVEEVQYVRRERPAHRFERNIQLPYRIEGESVEATYADGVLMLTLPRLSADKPRQIEIKSN